MNINELNFIDKIIGRSKSSYWLSPEYLYHYSDRGQSYQDFRVYHYNNHILSLSEKEINGLNVTRVLRLLFNIATKDVDTKDHSARWLKFNNFMANIMRHPTVCQPMYPDKTLVTHPLVLLSLGEGRCGHIARLAVDFAIANGYEARLVQLAPHLAGEVKWDNKWHLIDANKHFSPDHLMKIWPFPSAVEMSKQPYLLDTLPARIDGITTLPAVGAYGKSNQYWKTSKFLGNPKLSSVYFAKEIFENKFSGDPQKPRAGIEYYTKNSSSEHWQNDRYYGWNDVQSAIVPCGMVPLEYARPKPRLIAPEVVYRSFPSSRIPVRIWVEEYPILVRPGVYALSAPRNPGYELRVSASTRGWNYDYPDFDKMPSSGRGDILTTSNLNEIDGMIGIDMPIPEKGHELYMEAKPKSTEISAAQFPGGLSEFHWPSSEIHVTIKDI